jgi:tight adherence protein C
MNSYLWLAIPALLFFLFLIAMSYAFIGKPSLAKRLRRQHVVDSEPESKWQDYVKRTEDVIKPLGVLVPRSPDDLSRQERRLVKAGIRRKDAAALFYGMKASLAILLFIIITATPALSSNLFLSGLLALLFGLMIPDLWLNQKIAARTNQIQLGLPNALDLTVVCVEAGMGLDQALMRIGREMERGFPDLSDEINLLGIEINAGRKRTDALRNLGKRTGSKDLQSLTATLIQTDRFGTSIAQSLRVFSESMRVTRRLRAEENAAKMAIKMLPPMVFFIFPALFIVILGPAVIAVIQQLLPAMSGK